MTGPSDTGLARHTDRTVTVHYDCSEKNERGAALIEQLRSES